MLIENAVAFDGHRFMSGKAVRIRNGAVAEIGESLTAAPGEIRKDLEGDYLVPGFVDVHIHGFRGSDTMRGEDDIRRMSRELARIGVGAFCPTTMSAPEEETACVLKDIRRVMDSPEPEGARVLGAHMEAPFLNPDRKGAQSSCYFTDPDWERFRAAGGDAATVRLITLAPERNGSEAFVRQAVKAGIRISAGHTDADAELLHRAGEWGADHVTHLFNAQSPLHHRHPGVPGAALADGRFYCEMICDGMHLHRDVVRMILLCKGARRTVAITDAMEAAGMPDGEYALGGLRVFVKDGAARLEDGTLAGSVLTMPEACSRLIHEYGEDPAAACAMCTSTPAESVGAADAGRLVPGSPGILTRWSPSWRMKSVLTEAGESCQATD